MFYSQLLNNIVCGIYVLDRASSFIWQLLEYLDCRTIDIDTWISFNHITYKKV